MKYALIGCGRIAENHIKAAVENKLDIVALCDIDISHIELLLGKTGFKGNPDRYIDYREMITHHPDLDLIAIATDSGSHAEIALYCIDAGINVIIEKPMAMSIEDANEIVRRSEEKQIRVSVCHQNRFNPAIKEMRTALELGRFGKLSHGTICIRWNRNRDYYMQSSWRGKWNSDGGCLFNQCIHGIDLLRWMMGDVDEIYGVTSRRFHEYVECEDVGLALVKFKNGAIGTIEGSVNVFPQNLEETICLFGEKGTVKIGGKSVNEIEVWSFADKQDEDDSRKKVCEQIVNVYGNGHSKLYADVIDSLLHNRKVYVDAVEGRNAVEMILAIYQSNATGIPVKLPLKHISSSDFSGFFDRK